MDIGVVIVTFNASDVIADCLESLLASRNVKLRIMVVYNVSDYGTLDTIRTWSRGKPWRGHEDLPFEPAPHGPLAVREDTFACRHSDIGQLSILENYGAAGGMNLGLHALMTDTEVKHVWILDPDRMAENGTAQALLECAKRVGRYGLIGGRISRAKPRDMIQSDGGWISLGTGTGIPINMTLQGRNVPLLPAGPLHYASGTQMFASRAFLECAGPMPEDYFLYYEETEWCLRRGDLPLVSCSETAVHHHGDHSIGPETVHQGPSLMSAYVIGRARMRFVAHPCTAATPVTFACAAVKAARFALLLQLASAGALLRGIGGFPSNCATLGTIGRACLPQPAGRIAASAR